jgi:type I site-specific restriction endonuclease
MGLYRAGKTHTAPSRSLAADASTIDDPVDKRALSERDICTKFITPAIVKGGWGRSGAGAKVEQQLSLDQFPSPDELWRRYCAWKTLTPESESIVTQDYYSDSGGKAPRYYQVNAINRVIEAAAKGQNRILLVTPSACAWRSSTPTRS